MLIEIDCSVLNTKQQLLTMLEDFFEEMYAPNYDALIDAARGFEIPLEIVLKNLEEFENPQELLEVLEIITKENSDITLSKQ